MEKSKILQTLLSTGLPAKYSHFPDGKKPPYLVYIGRGQAKLPADDTHYWSKNLYQVEYYFTEKNEATETQIEKTLLDAGYTFSKSEDVYLDDENVFLIYYYLN